MAFTLNDIPEDVLLVFTIRMLDQPVGKETWDKCKKITEQYPEWFPDDPNEEIPANKSFDEKVQDFINTGDNLQQAIYNAHDNEMFDLLKDLLPEQKQITDKKD